MEIVCLSEYLSEADSVFLPVEMVLSLQGKFNWNFIDQWKT